MKESHTIHGSIHADSPTLRRYGIPLLPLILCAVLTGCSSYRRQGPPKFDVEVSFLDYANFTFHQAAGKPSDDHPILVRIELGGSGHVHYAKGRSSRVHDSFWTDDPDEKYADDIYTDQVVLNEKQVREVFQSLVDAGIFEREVQENRVENPGRDFVLIHAKINERRGIVITDSREFIGIYTKLARHFAR